MEVFVIKALERLRAESSRRDTEFREACDGVSQRIQENSQRPNREPDNGDADKYWLPFQLACEIKNSKMKALALDCIEKMIAFGYLRGAARVKPAGGAERPLIDSVVEAICSCRDDPGDAVQLQVVKALNTAIGSTSVHVHEGSLLLAVRSVYHVCLASRNANNRNTAKGTLRQMLSMVFVRMEKWHMDNKKQEAAAAATAAAAGVAEVPPPSPTAPPAAPTPAAPAPAPAPPTLVKRTVTVVRKEKRSRVVSEAAPSPVDPFWPNMYPQAAAALGYAFAPVMVTRTVEEEVEVEGMEEVEVEVAPPSPAPSARPAAVAAAPATPSAPESVGDVLGGLPSLAHRDAFLVFRSLARLTAMAEEEAPLLPAGGGILAALGGGGARPSGAPPLPVLSDEALLANPVALQSKLLSLDLVVGLLESAGPALQNGPRFIAAIKTYLCVGLLKNFVSTIPALSSLSLKAFMALVKGFKRHVAPEMEVFISTIFMRILTSGGAATDQKLAVLAAFRSMCMDPATVLEMFLNYDCVEGRQNVFEDSIRTLAGISQGPGRAGEAIAALALATQAAAAAGGPPADGMSFVPGTVKLPPGMEGASIKAAAMQALSAVMQTIVVLADTAAKQIADSEGGLAALIDHGAAEGGKKGKGGKEEEDGEDAAADVAAVAGEEASSGSGAAGPMSPGGATSGAGAASAALARSYELQKRNRAMLAKAAVKFAVKPKKGVEFLQAAGLCGPTPADIAAVFHELADVLDKTAIGEYMGEEKAAHVATLHAYVDLMDFTGLSFDDAIRKFLSGFRLPGEAQKIDRMMEKLAERFCKCNPGVFPTADTAFILAYSIIMLHTDLHNPNIKEEKRMTKDNFRRNNRGIANGADLPAEFLGAIFDSIKSRPFTLREDDHLRAKKDQAVAAVDDRARREMQLRERADIVAAGTAQLSSLTSARRAAAEEESGAGGPLSAGLSLSTYVSFSDVSLADHVRPMFEGAWGSLLAVWSVNFEQAGDDGTDGWTVNACLSGFNQAIHVAGALRMEVERDTLVATLAKFTALALGEAAAGSVGGGSGSLKELRGKHVAAVRALLSMAFHEGNNLGPAWGHVLAVVSAVARLQNVAMGGKDDAAFFPVKERAGPPVIGANTSAGRAEAARLQKLVDKDTATDRANAALLAGHVREADISRLFAHSPTLSTPAIVDFVSQLAAVSLFELASVVVQPPEGTAIGRAEATGAASYVPSAAGLLRPRIFSLQKVVEVAEYNMALRPRMAWARMWDSLSPYFTAVCTSSNTQVAMFAIDSLKQLSLKFCDKPELASFSFQTKFLQPFVAIMEATAPAALAAAKERAKGAVPASGPGGGPVRRGVVSAAVPMPEIRELVLHVCANIIRARAANIRSGWRSFLAVYAACSGDSEELSVSLAFSMAHEVVDTHFAALVGAGAFNDAVKCMVAFGSNPGTLFALRAVDHLTSLGAAIARGRVPPEGEAVEGPEGAGWYSLDGTENADVVDDGRDKAWTAAGSGAQGVGGRGYAMDNFDGGEAGAEEAGEGAPLSAGGEDAAAEDALDAAMLAADGVRGGAIRRFGDSTPHLQLWFPLLTGLAALVSSDARQPVRMRAMHALFALLRRYGPGFDAHLWALVYSGVLFPIFDDVFHVLREGDEEAVAGLATSSPIARGGAGDMEGGDSAPHYSLTDFSTRAIPAPARSGMADAWPSRRTNGAPVSEHEWLRTTCLPALSALTRLQSRFFSRLSFLLPGLLRLIERCVDQEIEGLARIGVAATRQLLAEAGPRFTQPTWDVVTSSLGRMFEATTPKALFECRSALLGEGARDGLGEEEGEDEAAAPAPAPVHPLIAAWSTVGATVVTPYGAGTLLEVGTAMARVQLPWAIAFINVPAALEALRPAVVAAAAAAAVPKAAPPAPVKASGPAPLPFSSPGVVTQCVVQLELIGCVGVLTEARLDSLSVAHVETLLGLLAGSAAFARRFNADRLLRRALWEAGFMRFAKHNKLPSLLRQETSATRTLLALLLRLYTYDGGAGGEGANWAALAITHLRVLIKGVLSRYNQLAVDVQRAQVLALPPHMHASLQFTSSGGAAWGGYTPERDALLVGEHSRDLFREAAAYGPMVLILLDGLLAFTDAQFGDNLGWLYPLLTGLVGCGSVEIRQRLSVVFAVRLRSFLPLGEAGQEEEGGEAGAAGVPEPPSPEERKSGARHV